MRGLKSAKMPRRNRNNGEILPLFRCFNGGHSKRTISKKWVHIVPITVIACFFILWFFSSQGLEVKDGRISEVPKVEKPISLSETRVDLTLLAVASPPHASISHMQTADSQIAAEPANRAE